MENKINNSIYNEDYKRTVARIKKQGVKVDAIITNPPYNISRDNNFKSIGRNGIDFGEWDKSFSQTRWIKTVSRIIKNGGSIIIFNDWKNLGLIASTLEKYEFDVKDILRWEKSNPMPRNTNRRYVTDYEFAIWAVKKGGNWTFNKNPEEPYLKPLFKHSAVLGKGKRIHPTQKPVELMQELIKIHTNKGDLVFDPFSGSGAVAKASLLEGIKFIASEINENYFSLSKKSLKKYE